LAELDSSNSFLTRLGETKASCGLRLRGWLDVEAKSVRFVDLVFCSFLTNIAGWRG
jgi:hypothetical protein